MTKELLSAFFGFIFLTIASLGACQLAYADSDYFQARRLAAEALFAKQAKTVMIFDNVHHYEVNQKLRYYEDSDGLLTIDDIQQKNLTQLFKQQAPGPLSFGYSDAAIWVTMPVLYKGKLTSSEFWLNVDTPLVHSLELYVVHNNGEIQHKISGYSKAMTARDILYPTSVMTFDIHQGEEVQLYLRITSDYSLHLPMSIESPKGFTERVAVAELFAGIAIGAILIMGIYNIFVFIAVREKAYLYYVLYIFTALGTMLTERVHGLQLWGEIPFFLHKHYLASYIWAFFLFAFLMAKQFINFRQFSPTLDYLTTFFSRVCFVSCVISLFAAPSVAVQWAAIGTLINTLFICWCAFTAMRYKAPGGMAYLCAWVFSFSGLTFYALAVNGKIPFNFLTWNAPQIGVLGQLILLSFAMGDRIKAAQRQALEADINAMSSLERYQSLFNNAVEGIFQITPKRQFIDANPAMCTLFGFSSITEMAAASDDAIAACYCDPEVYQKIVTDIELERDVNYIESRYYNRQGKVRWAASTLRYVKQEQGFPAYIEGSFVDITEKKEQEQLEREQALDKLQRQVAEDSAASKSQFLANMSHEIRTPLTAIIGYGETLLDDSMSQEEALNSAGIIVRSGHHLLELINDILDHSRIDENKLEVELKPVSLLDMIAEVKSYFEPKARQKGIDFSIQYDFPLPEKIHTDPTRLKQILINLCGNALKFTNRGSIRINLHCDIAKEAMHIGIMDSGIGLKPDQISRLFDAFAQAAPSTAREYGGTGLGLNISKRLAELLGGTIGVTSTFGIGSEFEVIIATGSLKDIRLIKDNSELNQRQLSFQTINIPKLRGSILYAEDNEVNRRLIELLVRKTGANLKIVNNGAEALQAATNEKFDLILMDIQMPIMDGKEATEAIRQSGNTTPIIALTANIMAEDIREYRGAGCNDCLAKPVDKKRFYAALAQYLEEV